MTFDEKLKARAEREGAPISEGFDIRMDALPDIARSYIACTPLIVRGKALSKLT